MRYPGLYPGCILAVSWLYPGCILAVSWLYPGCILAVSWLYPGCILSTERGSPVHAIQHSLPPRASQPCVTIEEQHRAVVRYMYMYQQHAHHGKETCTAGSGYLILAPSPPGCAVEAACMDVEGAAPSIFVPSPLEPLAVGAIFVPSPPEVAFSWPRAALPSAGFATPARGFRV